MLGDFIPSISMLKLKPQLKFKDEKIIVVANKIDTVVNYLKSKDSIEIDLKVYSNICNTHIITHYKRNYLD